MHGPTCIFWTNLTPFSLKASSFDVHFRVYGDAYGMLKLEGGAGGETGRSVQSACLRARAVLPSATH
jgi:hypothetical protein